MGRKAYGAARNDYDDDDYDEVDKNNFMYAEVRTNGSRGFVNHTEQSDESIR
jgi:hypothetical protein